jgi:hypothetical protein
MVYLQLLTQIGFRRIASSFLSVFGFLWLLIEPGAFFFPQYLNFGWIGYFGLAALSLAIAVILNFPRRSVCQACLPPTRL